MVIDMVKNRSGGKYVHYKYCSTAERNTPEYKLWRLSVYQRDGFKCKKCGQKLRKGRNLQAHHIMPWATYPLLRYDVNNGITLCWDCHKIMKEVESAYIPMCRMLIGNMETFVQVQRLLREEMEREEDGKNNNA
jgi:predicted HNH restriction endonuclease